MTSVNLNKKYKDKLYDSLENKEKQRKLYYEQMKQAAKDPNFIKRTMSCQKDFEISDLEVEKLISNKNYGW